jgi:hypothetical protein
MIHYADLRWKLENILRVPREITNYCINYGKDFPVRDDLKMTLSIRNSEHNNEYLFSEYLKTCISLSAKDNFEEKLKQYIMNYYHVSEDKSKLQKMLFTHIYENLFKQNLYYHIEKQFKTQVEKIKKEVSSIDRYESRGETPKEKIKDIGLNYKEYSIVDWKRPSTIYRLYKYFYPNSNKFEFKDIFQYTQLARNDEWWADEELTEKKKLSLQSYLHKRLTVSPKEAGLIESIVKQYVQKKKRY